MPLIGINPIVLPENNNVLFSANSDVLKTENKDV